MLPSSALGALLLAWLTQKRDRPVVADAEGLRRRMITLIIFSTCVGEHHIAPTVTVARTR